MMTYKEGKAKKLYWNGESETAQMEFKDAITAFNGQKQENIKGKGLINSSISAKLFNFLNSQKIQTHYLKQVSPQVAEVTALQMIPIEVIIRNFAAGSICERLGIQEGHKFDRPIIQFHLKDDKLNDPLLCESEILELKIISASELMKIKNQTLIINWLLLHVFSQAEIDLIDMKLEFGFNANREIYLADELSPDNMRLWLRNTDNHKPDNAKKLDKDRYRQGLGGVLENYEFISDKLSEVLISPKDNLKTPVEINLFIYPQAGLLDPSGRTLTSASKQLGFNEVENIKFGKFLNLKLSDLKVNLVEDLCERLLISPASESFEYEIIPAVF